MIAFSFQHKTKYSDRNSIRYNGVKIDLKRKRILKFYNSEKRIIRISAELVMYEPEITYNFAIVVC